MFWGNSELFWEIVFGKDRNRFPGKMETVFGKDRNSFPRKTGIVLGNYPPQRDTCAARADRLFDQKTGKTQHKTIRLLPNR